jgi:hypothetical protein
VSLTANAVLYFNRYSAPDVILGLRICLMPSLATVFERLLFFAQITAADYGVLAKMWLSTPILSMSRSDQSL